MKKEHTMTLGAVVVGLIVGLAVGYGLWGRGEGASLIVDKIENVSDTVAGVASENTAAVGGAAFSIYTQNTVDAVDQPFGARVMMARVKVDKVSWIAVHEDINGELGNVLGARSVAPGEYTDLPVPLLRGTVRGGTYHVGIYVDNGDLSFDRKIDTLLRGEDGEMVGSTFVAQ